MNMLTRERAHQLVEEYTTNKNLIKHMLAVEAAMKSYAKKFGEDEEKYSVLGLVHDFDYEKMKEAHPSEWGYELLRAEGADEDIIQGIVGHANRTDPSSRHNNMHRALFAVDELTGFIVAYALMKPNQISELTVEGIIKKFKDKGFAKGVNREDITNGAQELGVSLEEHVTLTLEAMRGIKQELGLI
jgi:predicted hydrolase (HD superfamily)